MVSVPDLIPATPSVTPTEAAENVPPTFNVKSMPLVYLMVLVLPTSVLNVVSIALPTDNVETVRPMLIVVLWMAVKSLLNLPVKLEFASMPSLAHPMEIALQEPIV